MKKIYHITVELEFIHMLLKELKAWGVKESRYKVEGNNCVITSDTNVVDVATETFSKCPGAIDIREEK